jgi:cytochrome b561
MQLVISGPVIFAGWSMGHDLANILGFQQLQDPHQQIGIALLALYVTQLLLGTFIHFIKFQGLFRGYRPPQNYLHIALGLAILALAADQVRNARSSDVLSR